MDEKILSEKVRWWFRQKREEKGLELSKLAEKSNVPLGTVMRVENGPHEMTLNTTVRLSLGLGLSFDDVLLGLLERKSEITLEPKNSIYEGGSCLTIEDLQRFGVFYKNRTSDCLVLLSNLLNSLCRKRNLPDLYDSSAVINLLYPAEDIPWQNNLITPPEIDEERVILLYMHGSVITRSELNEFLSHIEQKYSLLKGSDKDFIDFWNRNRTKSEGWNIKLIDLLKTDEFLSSKGMTPGGILFDLWWSNEYFNTLLFRPYIATALEARNNEGFSNPPWTYEMAKATQIFHKVYRWLENYQINEDLAQVIYKALTEKR